MSDKELLELAAKRTLESGQQIPYDARDDGPALPAADWAHEAARGVLFDLSDRRGIKNGFWDIDYEIRVEIVETLAAIIRAAAELGRSKP